MFGLWHDPEPAAMRIYIDRRASPPPIGQQRASSPMGRRAPPLPIGQRAGLTPNGRRVTFSPIGRRAALLRIGRRTPLSPNERRAAPLPIGRRTAPSPMGKMEDANIPAELRSRNRRGGSGWEKTPPIPPIRTDESGRASGK